MTRFTLAMLCGLAMVASGCATGGRTARATPTPERPPPPAVVTPTPDAPPGPAAPTKLATQTGMGSWYGRAHHGQKTASGERYDMRDLTGAHKSLPLGTRVRVTNVANGRSIVVRINDRGPFVDGRIIDVSHAAARALGALGAGVFTARLEVLEDTAEGSGAGSR